MYQTLLPYIERWFRELNCQGLPLPSDYGTAGSEQTGLDQLPEVFEEFQRRMHQSYPFHRPEYAGQMLKPPHPVAWLAYTLAMSINPNNHALDGGPETSLMEKEVVKQLAGMVGYPEETLGHLTSGGTIANLEALWVAKCIHPDKPVLFSVDAHYTHQRMCEVLGLEGIAAPVNKHGVLDIHKMEPLLKNAGTLVVTMGTTGRGTVDPLEKLIPLCRKYGTRIHVDAAYGGFFSIIKESLRYPEPWKYMCEADSIVIDPHKHGLQPYGCGGVLFRNPAVGKFYKHDSPYTYFTSDELHLGEITLECSRAGASAAALWFTIQALGLDNTSVFASSLRANIEAATLMAGEIDRSETLRLLSEPQTDIVCYLPNAASSRKVSEYSEMIFRKGMEDRDNPFYISLFKMDSALLNELHPDISVDSKQTTILRSVLMKPSHQAFASELVQRMDNICRGFN